MKYLTQVVLPIVILLAGIGGITFVVQYVGPRSTATRPASASEDFLGFSRKQASWEDDTSDYPAEFELYTPHHCDFLYENRTASAGTLGLESKSCACADVSVAVQASGETATERHWQPLEPKGAAVAVPPATAAGPALVWLRLQWQGRKVGRESLQAMLWAAKAPGRDRQRVILHLPVVFVPPVQVDAETVTVKEITAPDQKETVEFRCWSATRSAFPLTVRQEKPSGNIRSEVQPLTAAECRQLAESRQPRSRGRAGYRVRVTVHERRDGHTLDLGPFRCKLLLSGPPETAPTEVMLAGVVRGAVTVLSKEDADGIQLRRFPTDRGTSKIVVLAAEEENVQVQLASWTPKFLEVRLEPRASMDGRRRWNLHVAVPPRALVGALPEDSGIWLQLQGDRPRRMRLPLSGQGTQ